MGEELFFLGHGFPRMITGGPDLNGKHVTIPEPRLPRLWLVFVLNPVAMKSEIQVFFQTLAA